jgi:hypothetical protein
VTGREGDGEGFDSSLDETGRFSVSEDERRLREALFALNRAIDPSRDDQERLVRVRDEAWELGVELYGWTD